MRKWMFAALAAVLLITVVATMIGVGFCNDGWISQSCSWHDGVFKIFAIEAPR